jgi:hypothetical protein
MNRRTFLASTIAVACTPAVGMAGTVKVELGEKIEQEWAVAIFLHVRYNAQESPK